MNMRSLCFHSVSTAHGMPWLWWDYVQQLGVQCAMKDARYTPKCAEAVFATVAAEKLGAPAAALAEWRACWAVDPVESDAPIPFLDAELAAQTGNDSASTVAMLPTVRVNSKQYRGSLEAASVLRALCASFPVDGEPGVCNEAWVSDNECAAGSEGALACSSGDTAAEGRTRCINTFAGAGYRCECGQGFLLVTDQATGAQSCTDVNECLLSSLPWSEPDCNCDRCACVNSVGGYR